MPGTLAVDTGQPLANPNGGWLGSAPDLGAYERGKRVPGYGPAADPVSAIGRPRVEVSLAGLHISPVPSFGDVRIDWRSARGRGAESVGGTLAVFDPSGRCVRRVQDLRGTSWKWDGRNDRGQPVAAGVYWARLNLGGRHALGRIVQIR